MEELIVTIGPTGTIRIEVQGVKGPGCLNRSKWLEDDLGITSNDRKTAEFYEMEHIHGHLRNQGQT